MRTIEECVEAALAVLTPQVRVGFAADPITVLRDGLDLKVQQAPHLAQRRGDGGACDGVSFLQDRVILFAPTPYSRRENFTLAHELGHWLVTQTPPVYDWLFEPESLARPEFDLEHYVALWDLTNRQDWELSERAQQGIDSLGYRPGPYSNREELLHAFDALVVERTRD